MAALQIMKKGSSNGKVPNYNINKCIKIGSKCPVSTESSSKCTDDQARAKDFYPDTATEKC